MSSAPRDQIQTEREKMLAGLPYDPGDPELVQMRRRSQALMRDYNTTISGETEQRAAIMGQLLGSWNKAVILPPFHADYGSHVHFGPGCFMNFGGIILDVCEVRIGARTQIGPGVQILAADHPRDAESRARGIEFGRPVTIGEDVWIGGGAIVLPGITVGDGAVIGAGSVVTRDVPPGATVVGNPARALPPRQP